MKTAVIAPLGMTPPAVSSFIDGIGEPISDIVLIITGHAAVRAGAAFLSAGLRRKYPYLRVHIEDVGYDDISTPEENFDFMTFTARQIRRQRQKFGCDKIYLNIAGGRKNMCVSLSLIGQILQADGVFHIVNHDVSLMNERLELFRSKIMAFGEAVTPEEADALYEAGCDDFDHILFPRRDRYEIIRIPTLPYPEDYLQYIVQNIYDGAAGLTHADRDLFVRHGILEQQGSRFELTPHGERFIGVILGR